jgi:predicted nucleic acid-binding protein
MERFASLRASLRRRGELIPDFDIVIAATALVYDLTLLTYNLRHFSRIPDLRIHQQP